MSGDKTYVTDNNGLSHRATRVKKVTPDSIIWSSNPNDYTVQVSIDGKWHRAVLTCDIKNATFFDNINIDKALVTGTDSKQHTALIVKPEGGDVTMSSIPTDEHSLIEDTTTGETAVNVYSEAWDSVTYQDNINVYKVLVTGSDGKTHTALLTTPVGGSVEVIVLGVAPLVLPDALEEPIVSLKAFGGCTQSDTPTPADPVDIVCNNGTVKARYSNGLPLTYQPLEYVSFQGSSFTLGVAGFDDATSEIYMEWKTDTQSVSSNYQSVFTVWSANTYNSWRMLTYYTETDRFYVYANSRNPSTAPNITVDAWHEIQVKSGAFKIDSTTYNPTVTTSLTPSDITFKIGSSQLNSYYKYIKLKRQGEWINIFLPAKRLSDDKVGLYDVINDVFRTSTSFTAGPDASIPIEVYVEGTQETIVIKDSDSTTVSTAVASALFSLGKYTDEQNVISGAITRKVGVIVLNGTENWVAANTADNYFTGITGSLRQTSNTALISTHYAGTTATVSQAPNNTIKLSTASSIPNDGAVYIKQSGFADAAAFKAYIAAQFTAGTPVIVVYPLAAATTESVAGQPMSTAEGENTAEISQASMSGLELEVKYVAGVSITIEEVEDTQLSPDVEVTIE